MKMVLHEHVYTKVVFNC